MNKNLLGCFLFILLQNSMALRALAGSEIKYDPFTDKTTIEIKSSITNKLPILWAKSSFQGRRFSQNQSISLGFFSSRNASLCQRPRFIADGQMVRSETESNNNFLATNPTASEFPLTSDLFSLKVIRKIADSKNIQYKLCDVVRTLKQDQKIELKKFVSLIESSL